MNNVHKCVLDNMYINVSVYVNVCMYLFVLCVCKIYESQKDLLKI